MLDATTVKKKAAVLYGLPALVLLAGFWSLGVRFGWTLPLGIQMRFLPPPGEVAGRMWDVAVGGVHDDAYSGSLWRHLAASTLRVLNGFLLAAALAIPLGVLMGRFGPVRRALETTVNLVRPIPVTAWAPLTLLIIGYGDRSTIFLIFVAAFFRSCSTRPSASRRCHSDCSRRRPCSAPPRRRRSTRS